jgi:hypothetical protein
VLEVERRRSLRSSLRPLAASAGSGSAESGAVKVLEDEQKRLATLWFSVSGVADEERIVGLPAQDGELFGRRGLGQGWIMISPVRIPHGETVLVG